MNRANGPSKRASWEARSTYNSSMIDITVNGETTSLERPEPLADLLRRLNMYPVRIAVEVNG